jgi:FAD:protein FMN transferase
MIESAALPGLRVKNAPRASATMIPSMTSYSRFSMTKMATVALMALLLLAFCPAGSSTNPHLDRLYVYNYENILGTSLELKILAASPAQSEKARDAALAEIDREAKMLSSWDPDSEFSRWFRTRDRAVGISPELFEVLDLFDRWRGRTQGALDASAETITRAWQNAAAQQRLPTPQELQAAVAVVRQVHWTLDAAERTATHTSDAPLALNSFVKSYIVGRSADAALRTAGVRAVIVNIGGDLVVRGVWQEVVAVADPRSDAENDAPIAQLLIHDRAVATSGDYRRGVEIRGRHYSHIVDPRTGQPAGRIISSTVVAPNPADAGALATALSVLSPDEGRALAASIPGAEFLLVTENGEKITSRGWSALAAPATTVADSAAQRIPAVAKFQTVAAQQTKDSVWNRDFELTIGLEVARIQEARALRPFVAVWIEDDQKSAVRTIALWYGKFRYLPELHIWYHDESLQPENVVWHIMNSISSATRQPGKYKLRWDGKDESGKLVPAGKYTVLIEASREHGTYQLIRQEMDFNGTPRQIDLPGNLEIASASLDYHKIVH